MIVAPLVDYRERVVIVEYGMSNLQSVQNALESLGCSAEITSDPVAIRSADRLILPGVGAFGNAMARLRERGLIEPMRDAVNEGKPFLGICLGMQLLADESFEHGQHEGLHFIPGSVRRLSIGEGLRIPHIGWNSVARSDTCPLYQGVKQESDFYFVHSYYYDAAEVSDVNGWCTYGMKFAASVGRGRVFGVQYHPEKSHRAGLTLLKNFLQC